MLENLLQLLTYKHCQNEEFLSESLLEANEDYERMIALCALVGIVIRLFFVPRTCVIFSLLIRVPEAG